MKLNILVVGDCIKLLKGENLTLIDVGQNKRFLEKYDQRNKNIKYIRKGERYINFPKGTLLKVDRVYIRKGDGSDYNSLIFISKNNKGIPDGRFFIPVNIVNSFDVEIITPECEDKSKPMYKQISQKATELRRNSKEYKNDFRYDALKYFLDVSQKPLYNCKMKVNIFPLVKKYEAIDINEIYNKALKNKEFDLKIKKTIKIFYEFLSKEKEELKNINENLYFNNVIEISFYKIKEDFIIKLSNNIFNNELAQKKMVYLYNYKNFCDFLSMKGIIEPLETNQKNSIKIEDFIKKDFGDESLTPNMSIINYDGHKGLIKNPNDNREFFIFYDFIKYFSFLNPQYHGQNIIFFDDEKEMSFDIRKLRKKLTKIKKENT